MAKKQSSKTRVESPILDANASGDELLAYELVRLFAGAMKSLNGGVLPIPLSWQEHIKQTLNPDLKPDGKLKSGKKPTANTKVRRVELAKDVLRETMLAEDSTTRKRIKSLKNAKSSKNIYRDIKAQIDDAAIELFVENENHANREAFEKRRQEMLPIKLRLDNGETSWNILTDPSLTADHYIAAKRYEKDGTPLEGFPPKPILTEREKARAWVSDGMNRYIHAPDEFPTVQLRDATAEKIAKAAYQYKKK